MGMEYDSPPVAGGFFSNKRNVLIAAGILGGGAGLVFLLSRRGASAPDPSQTTKGATAQDIAWGNLANQLLGFRGDVSVAMAKQSDQQHDLLDQFLTESQARQASDSQLFHLTSWLDFAREYETRQNMYAQAINASDDPTTRERSMICMVKRCLQTPGSLTIGMRTLEVSPPGIWNCPRRRRQLARAGPVSATCCTPSSTIARAMPMMGTP